MMSAEFKEDKGGAYYGHSRYGHATYDGTPDFEEILLVVFPETKGQKPTKNQTRDAMSLATHRKYGRGYRMALPRKP